MQWEETILQTTKRCKLLKTKPRTEISDVVINVASCPALYKGLTTEAGGGRGFCHVIATGSSYSDEDEKKKEKKYHCVSKIKFAVVSLSLPHSIQ